MKERVFRFSSRGEGSLSSYTIATPRSPKGDTYSKAERRRLLNRLGDLQG